MTRHERLHWIWQQQSVGTDSSLFTFGVGREEDKKSFKLTLTAHTYASLNIGTTILYFTRASDLQTKNTVKLKKNKHSQLFLLCALSCVVSHQASRRCHCYKAKCFFYVCLRLATTTKTSTTKTNVVYKMLN